MALKVALLLAAIGVSAVNGAPSSPLFDPVLYWLRPALAPLTVGPDTLFHLSSIFIALATLMLSGISAAIYERARALPQSTVGSMAIWLSAALLLSLPGLLGAAGFYDIE